MKIVAFDRTKKQHKLKPCMFRIKSLYFLPPAFVKTLGFVTPYIISCPGKFFCFGKNPRYPIPSGKEIFLENSDKFVGYNVVLVA